MKQKHQKVSTQGKGENSMRTAYITHSTKHEEKHGKHKIVDLFPPQMRKG